ncbi:MAG: gamma-glutamylcyclotransferase [Gammaproteobacteria bacterium]|nr:gamma-glutamylcyclotransferase [Gammaproteobacteria bacterium]MDH3769135.1 gamma-glutamylcyclotransferase [Gammaproteobacteria bacterium]
MPLLFSYGTLQDERVQRALFGRTLVGRKDCLLGYAQALARVADPEFARTSGKTHHAILRPARSDTARVEGMAFEVTDAELEHADKYEPVEYKRVLARLASGGQAWVYVDAQIGSEPC